MIKISYGRTVNLGNYESLRIDCEESIESNGLSSHDIIINKQALYISCKKFVEEKVALELANKKQAVQQVKDKIFT